MQGLAMQIYISKKYTINQICKMMDISKPTFYKYIETRKAQLFNHFLSHQSQMEEIPK